MSTYLAKAPYWFQSHEHVFGQGRGVLQLSVQRGTSCSVQPNAERSTIKRLTRGAARATHTHTHTPLMWRGRPRLARPWRGPQPACMGVEGCTNCSEGAKATPAGGPGVIHAAGPSHMHACTPLHACPPPTLAGLAFFHPPHALACMPLHACPPPNLAGLAFFHPPHAHVCPPLHACPPPTLAGLAFFFSTGFRSSSVFGPSIASTCAGGPAHAMSKACRGRGRKSKAIASTTIRGHAGGRVIRGPCPSSHAPQGPRNNGVIRGPTEPPSPAPPALRAPRRPPPTSGCV